LETPWDPLQRAYFNGYALWTYLTTPFLLTMPGFTVTEIDPVNEDGERWEGLQAHFPDNLASNSRIQATTSCRPTESSCRPNAGLTAATPMVGQSPTTSWCQSTLVTSTCRDDAT
jgi:hypothetical protein